MDERDAVRCFYPDVGAEFRPAECMRPCSGVGRREGAQRQGFIGAVRRLRPARRQTRTKGGSSLWSSSLRLWRRPPPPRSSRRARRSRKATNWWSACRPRRRTSYTCRWWSLRISASSRRTASRSKPWRSTAASRCSAPCWRAISTSRSRPAPSPRSRSPRARRSKASWGRSTSSKPRWWCATTSRPWPTSKASASAFSSPHGFADILSKTVLRAAHINPKDVNFVSIATEDVPALVADQVDTAILHVEQEMLAKEKVPSTARDRAHVGAAAEADVHLLRGEGRHHQEQARRAASLRQVGDRGDPHHVHRQGQGAADHGQAHRLSRGRSSRRPTTSW